MSKLKRNCSQSLLPQPNIRPFSAITNECQQPHATKIQINLSAFVYDLEK
jgi:hypothetical protein